MEIPSKYSPVNIEDKWYAFWLENRFFNSTPDEREAFTIVIPPPNVTGVLHMGHMLNNTIQDVLIRRARMLGKNACWVPGTDHASIATEAKVVNKLRGEGIKKSDLSRDEFLKHAWEWTDKHGGIILNQLQKLGASCDWDRTSFTMSENYYDDVINTFIHFFEKGLIYRGKRIINWDPKALTALSDEEVIYKEVNSKLYHVKYKIEGEDEWITIATTRPETILGDTAVCVHPDDERYKHLHGKKAIIPMVNRAVPIICDDYIEMEFGTGCLKVTPAHDINDYEIGVKHDLEVIDTLNPDGTLSEVAGFYVGQDRFVVRNKIAEDLDEMGQLVKVEKYTNKVGFSERTDAVVEPRLSLQWFLNMQEISKPALENVMNGEVQFHPAKLKNSYKNWMENIKDWCVSRQLWWGHQIPAWYYGEGDEDFVVAKTKEEALVKAADKSGRTIAEEELKQDEDVMDTWFSSWLWPISVFNGIKEPENDEINYYYPTNDLVTAPEIMFFWVARMIIAGYEFRGKKPFSNVYYTGIVRDKLGRKMSKQLGNSPDPIELMKEYGADGVRVGMLLTSPAGNDLPFDESLCLQGRNFANKIWNALRLVKSWEVSDVEQPESSKVAIEWFESKFGEALENINGKYDDYRISEALMGSYKLIWDDFCGWFLESVKPPYQQPIDSNTYVKTINLFERLMQVIHPFMPFLSEEVWHLLNEREDKVTIMFKEWPTAKFNEVLNTEFDLATNVVSGVRNARKENNIAKKDALELCIKENKTRSNYFDSLVAKLANVISISVVQEKPDTSFSFMVGGNEYFVPLGVYFNADEEIAKLQKELDYAKGSLSILNKKLENERFVKNAPEAVVTAERKKQKDTENKIEILEEKLATLT